MYTRTSDVQTYREQARTAYQRDSVFLVTSSIPGSATNNRRLLTLRLSFLGSSTITLPAQSFTITESSTVTTALPTLTLTASATQSVTTRLVSQESARPVSRAHCGCNWVRGGLPHHMLMRPRLFSGNGYICGHRVQQYHNNSPDSEHHDSKSKQFPETLFTCCQDSRTTAASSELALATC